MDPSPGTELGKYTVVRPLGSGGMGVVVLARHRELGSLHAIKLLRAEGPEVDARLRQEGRLQATLSHPNVVKVTDTVDVNGRAGLVMEYVDGPTLAEFTQAHRPLSFAEVDRLARGILRGVAEAHDQEWIHRDIKPGNILLQITKDEIVPKVADFGLAKVLGGDGAPDVGDTSRYGLGTRGYMPLEQLVGAKPDARMDVFALGAVLYELAVGRPAFPNVEAWEAAIRSGSYPDPSRDGLPIRMRDAIRASLADRGSRPATARELLELWIGGEDADLPGFRAEVLRGGRRLDDHLSRDRLVSETLTPTERSHLEWCVQCRSEARLARAYLDPERDPDLLTHDEPSPATFTPSDLGGRVELLVRPTSAQGVGGATGRRWWWLVPIAILFAALPIPFLLADGGSPPSPLAVAPAPPDPPPPVVRPTLVVEAVQSVPSVPVPEPPPVRQPPRPPAPVGTATLIVNTVGGPAGRFQVDQGPLTTVGPLRKQKVPAGRHRVKIFPHDGEQPVWEAELMLDADAETVLCWDLASRSRCAH